MAGNPYSPCGGFNVSGTPNLISMTNQNITYIILDGFGTVTAYFAEGAGANSGFNQIPGSWSTGINNNDTTYTETLNIPAGDLSTYAGKTGTIQFQYYDTPDGVTFYQCVDVTFQAASTQITVPTHGATFQGASTQITVESLFFLLFIVALLI